MGEWANQLSKTLEFHFDKKLEKWENGRMKTTIDLPEDLVREVKMRAARQNRKLKDVFEEVFRRGLRAAADSRSSRERNRISLPIVSSPAGAVPFELSGDRLLELEMEATRVEP